MPGVGKAGEVPDAKVLRNLEVLSGNKLAFHNAYNDLIANKSECRLVSLGLIHEIIPPDQAEHFDRDFFPCQFPCPGGGGFWSWLQPIEPTFRQGLIKAFSLAIVDQSTGTYRENPLPLKCELDTDGTTVLVKSDVVDNKFVHVKVILPPV
jgi:hypothetical protein